jgi:hypothetical protein
MPESRSARPLGVNLFFVERCARLFQGTPTNPRKGGGRSLKIEVFSRIKDILCKVEVQTGQTLVETLDAAISLMNALGIFMVLSCTASMAPGAQSLRRTLYDVILLTPVQRLAR